MLDDDCASLAAEMNMIGETLDTRRHLLLSIQDKPGDMVRPLSAQEFESFLDVPGTLRATIIQTACQALTRRRPTITLPLRVAVKERDIETSRIFSVGLIGCKAAGIHQKAEAQAQVSIIHDFVETVTGYPLTDFLQLVADAEQFLKSLAVDWVFEPMTSALSQDEKMSFSDDKPFCPQAMIDLTCLVTSANVLRTEQLTGALRNQAAAMVKNFEHMSILMRTSAKATRGNGGNQVELGGEGLRPLITGVLHATIFMASSFPQTGG